MPPIASASGFDDVCSCSNSRLRITGTPDDSSVASCRENVISARFLIANRLGKIASKAGQLPLGADADDAIVRVP